jgi:hypothetical protein
LQEHFDAVMHYDLSWNPTRHEQREGRVDRYGQPSPTVRTLTYYGVDNQIDGVVLEVLLRKHKTIRSSLGISVPAPANSDDVVQALMEGLMLRGGGRSGERGQLSFLDLSKEFAAEVQRSLHTLHSGWDNVTERERRSRTLFAQRTLDVSEVAEEWAAVRAAIGTSVDVARFVEEAIVAHEGFVGRKPQGLEVHVPNRAALREICAGQEMFLARFELPVADGALYLARTHPIVEGLATHVLDTALDPLGEGVARRCGAIRTRAVTATTTLLLLRYRFHLTTRRGGATTQMLAEACDLAGFQGSPAAPTWLTAEQAETLLAAEPDQNVPPALATQLLGRIIEGITSLQADLNQAVERRAAELLASHRRVRTAIRSTGVQYSVEPQRPPDVLGIYLLLPVV